MSKFTSLLIISIPTVFGSAFRRSVLIQRTKFLVYYFISFFYIIPAALVSIPKMASIWPGLLLALPACRLSAGSHKARHRAANGRQRRTLWCHPGGLHGRLRRSGGKSEGARGRQPRPRGAAAVSAAQVLAPPSWCVRSERLFGCRLVIFCS
jgi:hypothetical protein